MMRPLFVSHFTRARDNEPRHARVTWEALSARLLRFDVRADLVAGVHRSRAAIDASIGSGAWRSGSGRWDDRIRARLEPLRRRGIAEAEALERVREQLHAGTDRWHKAELPAWCPAVFVDGAKRSGGTVEAVHLAVLDYDDGSPIDAERERWVGFAYALHTSWSHTPGRPKYRIALPLATPIPAGLWPRVFCHLFNRTGGRIDGQTKNADRLFFLPAVKSRDAERFAVVNPGAWLDLDPAALPLTPAEVAEARRRERPLARAWYATHEDRDRALALALRTDPDARRRVADELGARVVDRSDGPIATAIPCPGCGDRSVWFALRPVRASSARCNHANTCGWSGSLADLRA